jgi:hypothetical protein
MPLIHLLQAAAAAGVYDESTNNKDVVNFADSCEAYAEDVEYTSTAAKAMFAFAKGEPTFTHLLDDVAYYHLRATRIPRNTRLL